MYLKLRSRKCREGEEKNMVRKFIIHNVHRIIFDLSNQGGIDWCSV
jgi:hypothetical protein